MRFCQTWRHSIIEFIISSTVNYCLRGSLAGMGQEPGTGIWLARNLNLIPGSWFLPEFLSLGTLGTSLGSTPLAPRPATSGQHSVAHSQQRRRLGGTCAAAVGNNPWTGAQMLESNPHLVPDASLTRSLHRSRLPPRRLDLAPSVVDTPAQRSDPPAPA